MRASCDIVVTPRNCVTIFTPQGGAVVMRVSVNSISAFDQVTLKDFKQDLDPLICFGFQMNQTSQIPIEHEQVGLSSP